MKYIWPLILIVSTNGYADVFTFTYYDPTTYDEISTDQIPLVPDGTLISVSDTYIYFNPFTETAKLVLTETVKDSTSPTLEKTLEPVSFDYTEVTLDNILNSFPWLLEDSSFINNILPQWQTTFTSSTNPQDLNRQYNILQKQNIQLANLAFHHNTVHIGRNGGDTDYNVAVWGQALYSYGNKHSKASFSTNTYGAIFGAETQITPSLNMGVGFGHHETTINHDDISINNNTLFLYGDYDTKSFFINSILAYTYGEYEYSDATHHGINNGLFASAILGKHIGHGFSPEVGVRYNNIKVKDKILITRELTGDIYTTVTGIEYKNNFGKIDLGGKLLVDYDLATPDNDVKLFVPNHTIHTKQKYDQNRLGTEIGLWTEYVVETISLHLEYDLYYQANYTNHTGRISFKYGF